MKVCAILVVVAVMTTVILVIMTTTIARIAQAFNRRQPLKGVGGGRPHSPTPKP